MIYLGVNFSKISSMFSYQATPVSLLLSKIAFPRQKALENCWTSKKPLRCDFSAALAIFAMHKLKIVLPTVTDNKAMSADTAHELAFGWEIAAKHEIKRCRRVATRYDKLAANYLAFVQVASIRLR
jgi:hypothetical protein